MDELSPKAQKLLNLLVKDFSSRMPIEERVYEKKWATSYLYNLFNGNYDYSSSQFNEIYKFLTKH